MGVHLVLVKMEGLVGKEQVEVSYAL